MAAEQTTSSEALMSVAMAAQPNGEIVGREGIQFPALVSGMKLLPSGGSFADSLAARAGSAGHAASMRLSAERTARVKVSPPSRILTPQARPGACLTIPQGVSPSAMLDSPVLLPTNQAEPSPTTGTFPLPPFFNGGGVRAIASSESMRDRAPDDNGQTGFVFKHFTPTAAPRSSPLSGLPPSGQYLANAAAVPRVPGAPLDDDGYAAPSLIEKPAEDGYNWRKYGQKQVKGSDHPRSYYKCTQPGCPVKKKVERSEDGQVTERVYKGMHNHPQPMPSRRVSVLHPSLPLSEKMSDVNVTVAKRPAESLPRDGTDALSWGSRWPGIGVTPGHGKEIQSGVSGISDLGQNVGNQKRKLGSGWIGEQASDSSEDVGEDDGLGHKPGADEEQQEADAKRRKLEKRDAPAAVPAAQKSIREPRLVIQATSEVEILDDGYRWRKYGQKVVKGNPHPRSYYKCTSVNCPVRKHVERSSLDPKEVITTYEGKHNHDVPALRMKDEQNKEAGSGGAAGTPVSGISPSSTGGLQTPSSLPSENNNNDEGKEEPGEYGRLLEGPEGEAELASVAKDEVSTMSTQSFGSDGGRFGTPPPDGMRRPKVEAEGAVNAAFPEVAANSNSALISSAAQ